jgi:hypothetical protein
MKYKLRKHDLLRNVTRQEILCASTQWLGHAPQELFGHEYSHVRQAATFL